MLGTTLWDADGITLGLDEGTELGYSDGSSDGSNELVLDSDEGIISFQLNQLLALFFNFAQIFTCPLLHPSASVSASASTSASASASDPL